MSAAIRAARAYVELFLKDLEFNKALDNAKLKLNAWKASLQSIGVAALGLGTAMVTPFTFATKAAGDMVETMSKLRAVFADQDEAVISWMDSFTAAVGRGKKETADGLAAFQAFFLGMGMGSKEAAELSKEMVSLAVDFGSFHNVADAEAMQRFISAFSGSSEVLDMFGINIKSAALDAKLLEMGFSTIANGATELQKVLARQAIIKESMGKQGAVGDAIRTADSFSNTLKRLQAQFMDLTIQIGNAVMPIFQQLMSWFSVGLASIKKWLDEHKTVAPFLLKAALAIGSFGAAMLALSGVITVVMATAKAFAFLGTALKALHLLFMLPVTPWGAAFKALALAAALAATAYSVFAGSAEKVTHAMQEQAEANARARTDDEVRMQRLQQLAEKQSLSNDEQKEAVALIDSLQSRYGNLGISIDSVTGKISGLTEAQKRLSEAMKAQEIADAQKELNEAQKNVTALTQSINGGTLSWWEALANNEGGRARIEQERKDRDVEVERIKALQAKLKALQDDGKGPVDVSAAETEKRRAAEEKAKKTEAERKKKLLEEGDNAAGELEKIDDERRRAEMTDTERQIDDVRKKALERQRLLITTTQGEHAREGGPRQEVLDMLNMLRDKYTADEEKDIAAIRKKAADEEAKKAEEGRRGQLNEIARKELDLKFAAKAGETDEQASKREHEKRLAMIELERKQAMDNLKEGLDPNLVNQDFDLQKRLAEAEFNARGVGRAEKSLEVNGSFSAAAIGRFAANQVQEKQLTELQEHTKLLTKIERKEGGIPVVGDNE